MIAEFRTNRYDEATETLTYTDNQARAFEANTQHYGVLRRRTPPGRAGPEAITDPAQVRQLTAYFAWTAWASAPTARPHLLLHQQLAG